MDMTVMQNEINSLKDAKAEAEQDLEKYKAESAQELADAQAFLQALVRPAHGARSSTHTDPAPHAPHRAPALALGRWPLEGSQQLERDRLAADINLERMRAEQAESEGQALRVRVFPPRPCGVRGGGRRALNTSAQTATVPRALEGVGGRRRAPTRWPRKPSRP